MGHAGKLSERRGLRSLLDRFVIFNPAVCNPAWQGMALNTRLRPLMLEGLARLLTFMAKEAVAPSARPAGKPVVVAVGSQNNYRSAIAALGAREDVEIVTFHNLRREDCGRIGLFRQYLTGLWICHSCLSSGWRKDAPMCVAHCSLERMSLCSRWARAAASGPI